MMLAIPCYKRTNCIYFCFFSADFQQREDCRTEYFPCWWLTSDIGLLGDTPFRVKLMSCHWHGNNFNVDFIDVLKSNCCHRANSLASTGFSPPHVALKPIFEIGVLNKLTSEIWITLPFSVASMDNTRPAKATEPLFRMKYFVFAGLNSVKIKSVLLIFNGFNYVS